MPALTPVVVLFNNTSVYGWLARHHTIPIDLKVIFLYTKTFTA